MINIGKSTLNGEVTAPSSKSHAIRYAIISGLSTVRSEIRGITFNEDIDDALSLLRASGSKIEFNEGILTVEPSSSLNFRSVTLNGSATVLRISIALAASYPGSKVIMVGKALRNRPVNDLIHSLNNSGATIINEGDSIIVKSPVKDYNFEIRADISSQFLTALIFLSIATERGISIRMKGNMVSRTYFDTTREIMENLGSKINDENSFIFMEPKRVEKIYADIPGDFALSSYFPSIVAKNGGIAMIKNLQYKGTGDSRVVDIFRGVGIHSKIEGDKWIVDGPADLKSIEIDMNDVPDLVPPLISVLSSSPGTSKIRGINHLEYKESNRVAEMIKILTKAGINSSYDGSSISIKGASYNSFNYVCPGDHRMAMLALSLQASSGGKIENESCLCKSYPGFIDDFKKLGGIVNYT
jgi:3-phosphoshikimate 1-carboxyvinyltransferase